MITPTDSTAQFNHLDEKIIYGDEYEDIARCEDRQLRRLLRIQAVFGITLCGTTPVSEKHTPVKEFLMLGYDVALISLFVAFEYLAFSADSFHRIFHLNPQIRGAMTIVFRASAVVVALEYLITKFLLIYNGKQIYLTIRSIGRLNPAKQVRFIYAFMFIMSALETVAMALNFAELDQTFTEFYNENTLKVIFFAFNGLVHSMVKTSILSLLMYTSLVIRQQLNGHAENFKSNTINNTRPFCESMLDLITKVEKLSSLSGLIIFTKIAVNSTMMASCLCSMAIATLDLKTNLALSCFLISSFLDISCSCHSSQLIINAMTGLCKRIQRILSSKTFNNEDDYKQLSTIVSMKKYLKYEVLDLFTLRDTVILSIIGLVANYTVILIQTQ